MRRSKKERDARREAILACTDRFGDVIPELVVKAARNPKSPLHNDFIWDDKKAAHKQRLLRAQEIILEVKVEVIVEDRTFAAPYFVSNPSRTDSAYIPTTTAAKNEEMSEAVLMDELRRIESAVIRARSLAAAFDLIAHFDRMLADVVEVRGRLLRRRGGDESRPTA